MSNRKRAEEVFYKVLAKPPGDRAESLRSLCGTDATLRVEVEALLAADSDPRSVGRPQKPDAVIEHAETVASLKTLGEGAGDSVGPYRLLQQIGEGGFGAVFMAEQREPVQRKVALKIIKPGMDTRQVIARFEQERQALAMMDHPNVARVLDAGSTQSGRPYFVMELVRGDPVTEYSDRNKLAAPERLDLFIQVCHAVQHAHQKGIIHRDIKPNNILVTIIDGRPVPKIIDFGIAKATAGRLTERTLFTEFRHFIGTPQYMSPEQAEMSGVDVDTRSDIYSLGVLLYELLTGTTPFDPRELKSAAYGELQRIIREVEPPRPSTRVNTLAQRRAYETPSSRDAVEKDAVSSIEDIARHRHTDPLSLSRFLRGDLDWIVMKCLEKDRTRRYDTVNGLALDIRRHLDGEPVVAAPPSTAYKFRKFVRRHKVGVITGTGIVTALLLGIIGTTLGMMRAVSAERQEGEQRARAEVAAATAEEARKEAASQLDRAVTAERLADDRAQTSEAVTSFLSEILSSVDPGESHPEMSEHDAPRKDMSVRELLAEAGAKLGTKFADQPLVEARLRSTIGKTYRNLALNDQAEQHLPLALKIYTSELGETHEETIRAMIELALLRVDQLPNGDAEALIVRSLALGRKSLGDEHEVVLLAMLVEAYIASVLGGDARPLVEPLLKTERRVLGEEHKYTLLTRTFAIMLGLFGESSSEKVARLEEVLEIQRRDLGKSHPFTVLTLEAIAENETWSESIPKLEQLLEARRRDLGDDDRRTLSSMYHLGLQYMYAGRPGEAVRLLERTLEGQRRVLGEEDNETLVSMHQLGHAYCRVGRVAEGIEMKEREVAARRRRKGDDSLMPWFASGCLAYEYRRGGRTADSVPLFEEVLAYAREKHKEDSQHALMYAAELGRAYVELGRPLDAVALLEPHLPSILSARSPDASLPKIELGDPLEVLGDAYRTVGRTDDARRMAVDRLDLLRRRVEQPELRPGELVAYSKALMTVEPEELRDPAAALPLAERASEMARGEDPEILGTLALAYHLNGDTPKALEIQRQATALLSPEESPLRSELEADLAKFEAALEDRDP